MSNLLHQAYELMREAVYHENDEGGKARGVVASISHVVGVRLADLPSGIAERDVWGLANMRRVLHAVEELKRERDSLRADVARLRGLPIGGFTGDIDIHVPQQVRGW